MQNDEKFALSNETIMLVLLLGGGIKGNGVVFLNNVLCNGPTDTGCDSSSHSLSCVHYYRSWRLEGVQCT